MKDRKEEILKKYANGWVGCMTSGDKDRIVYPAMEEYAQDRAIGFAEWLGENEYAKMWLGEQYVGWADKHLMKQNKSVPIKQLYQQYLESIPQPSK